MFTLPKKKKKKLGVTSGLKWNQLLPTFLETIPKQETHENSLKVIKPKTNKKTNATLWDKYQLNINYTYKNRQWQNFSPPHETTEALND